MSVLVTQTAVLRNSFVYDLCKFMKYQCSDYENTFLRVQRQFLFHKSKIFLYSNLRLLEMCKYPKVYKSQSHRCWHMLGSGYVNKYILLEKPDFKFQTRLPLQTRVQEATSGRPLQNTHNQIVTQVQSCVCTLQCFIFVT